MKRAVTAFLAGAMSWAVIVSLIDRGLRRGLNGYAAAEPTLHFTLGMQCARLAMAAVTSLAAGAVIKAVDPGAKYSPWVLGAVLLAAFLPSHVSLWHTFPIWYHLTFLVPLAPLIALGAHCMPKRAVTAATRPEPPHRSRSVSP
jgi:hypothetical protein